MRAGAQRPSLSGENHPLRSHPWGCFQAYSPDGIPPVNPGTFHNSLDQAKEAAYQTTTCWNTGIWKVFRKLHVIKVYTPIIHAFSFHVIFV